MKLYWAPRTRAFRALWLLEEVGVPYERERVQLDQGGQDTPEFAALNPMRKVPVVVDGEAVVSESAAIFAYVADAVPRAGLAPAIGNPLRGRYLTQLVFSHSALEAAMVQKAAGFEMNGRAAGWGDAGRVLDTIETWLSPGPWVLGSRFSAADVAIGGGLYYAVRSFGMLETRPAFEAYIDRCMARPAFRRAQAIDEKG